MKAEAATILTREEFYDETDRLFGINGLKSHLSDTVKERLFDLTRIMLEENSKMNLTALTRTEEIILKHYADSITAEKFVPKGAKIIDVGCGAGFPALPLAIARDDVNITALDSTAKRIEYVRNTAHLLGLSNIEVLCARAEAAAHDAGLRERFDVACARAVARMEILCEYCIPFLKKDGLFIAMKAKPDDTEIEGAKRAAHRLCATIEKTEKFTITDGTDTYERTMIVIRKHEHTPSNFPRNNSQITKKPL